MVFDMEKNVRMCLKNTIWGTLAFIDRATNTPSNQDLDAAMCEEVLYTIGQFST